MDEGRQILVQGGLPARDADPVNPISERVETLQNVFEGNGGVPLRMKDEGVVVAIRTPEVTRRKEED
jgi:hypothetical protein